jgi:hypothetical protein
LQYNPEGIDEISSASIVLYPNPTNGKFFIETKEFPRINSEIIIIDLTGIIICRQVINKPLTEINLSDQPKGIYIVQIKTDRQISTGKLLIK